MAHTALTKAIEQLSEYRDTYNSMCDEFTLIDKCVEQLTDLLPYERETIEDAFEDGNQNGSTYPQGFCGDATSKYDYFTKTYKND